MSKRSASAAATAATAPEPTPDRPLHGWVERVEPESRSFCLRSGERRIVVRCAKGRLRRTFDALGSESVVRVWVAGDAGGDAPEVECVRLELLNTCRSLPFRPAQRKEVSAGLRSRFRYLEFRDPEIQRLLRLRHRVQHAVSTFLDERSFISVETPILATPSASGANEFRVSSSRNPAVEYALPQSPQVYGHLLVLGGVERYYQWARCFRDEDLRTNRQPEFTQLHVEAAFLDCTELMELITGAVEAGVAAADRAVTHPVERISFDAAMRRYGSDKPDLRFAPDVELLPYRVSGERKVQALVQVRLPSWLVLEPGHVHDLRRVAWASRTRFLGFLPPRPRPLGWLKQTVELAELETACDLSMVPHAPYSLLWVGTPAQVDALHLEVYRWVSGAFVPPEDEVRFAWVTDFPLFARDPAGSPGLVSFSHPFTHPRDVGAFEKARRNTEFLALRGQALDLVLNGEEIGSGSMLIYQPEMQLRVLRALGIPNREIRRSYGFLLDALRYGAPPIGGFGMGLDRLLAKLCAVDKIRQVMAFPKTKQGYCPVTHRPA